MTLLAEVLAERFPTVAVAERERPEPYAAKLRRQRTLVRAMTTTAIPACGTRGGYERHRKNGQPIDDACRQAYRADSRQRKATQRRRVA